MRTMQWNVLHVKKVNKNYFGKIMTQRSKLLILKGLLFNNVAVILGVVLILYMFSWPLCYRHIEKEKSFLTGEKVRINCQ